MAVSILFRYLSVATFLLCGCSAFAAQAPPADLPITFVVMHRSACYGRCPVYTVEVLSNGEVRYDGEEHVKIKGRHTAHIPADEFAFLVESIRRVRFQTLHQRYTSRQDGCPSYWTDRPGVDIVVARGNRKKRVSYYYGCMGLAVLQRIIWLSETIDDVANSVQWVGTDAG